MLSRKTISESDIFVRRDETYAIWDKDNLCWTPLPIPIYEKYYLFRCFICGKKIHNPERFEKGIPIEFIWCYRCRQIWLHYNKFKKQYDQFIIFGKTKFRKFIDHVFLRWFTTLLMAFVFLVRILNKKRYRT